MTNSSRTAAVSSSSNNNNNKRHDTLEPQLSSDNNHAGRTPSMPHLLPHADNHIMILRSAADDDDDTEEDSGSISANTTTTTSLYGNSNGNGNDSSSSSDDDATDATDATDMINRNHNNGSRHHQHRDDDNISISNNNNNSSTTRIRRKKKRKMSRSRNAADDEDDIRRDSSRSQHNIATNESRRSLQPRGRYHHRHHQQQQQEANDSAASAAESLSHNNKNNNNKNNSTNNSRKKTLTKSKSFFGATFSSLVNRVKRLSPQNSSVLHQQHLVDDDDDDGINVAVAASSPSEYSALLQHQQQQHHHDITHHDSSALFTSADVSFAIDSTASPSQLYQSMQSDNNGTTAAYTVNSPNYYYQNTSSPPSFLYASMQSPTTPQLGSVLPSMSETAYMTYLQLEQKEAHWASKVRWSKCCLSCAFIVFFVVLLCFFIFLSSLTFFRDAHYQVETIQVLKKPTYRNLHILFRIELSQYNPNAQDVAPILDKLNMRLTLFDLNTNTKHQLYHPINTETGFNITMIAPEHDSGITRMIIDSDIYVGDFPYTRDLLDYFNRKVKDFGWKLSGELQYKCMFLTKLVELSHVQRFYVDHHWHDFDVEEDSEYEDEHGWNRTRILPG